MLDAKGTLATVTIDINYFFLSDHGKKICPSAIREKMRLDGACQDLL